MYRKFRFLLIMSCLSFLCQANAQFDAPKTLEVGPHCGMGYYMGDLNPMLPFAQAQLQYGGVLRYNYDTRWAFRIDYSRVNVTADDKKIGWRPERGLNFMSKIHDFSFVVEFNFIEYYTGNPTNNVSPYIFGGISVFQYTAYAEVGGTWVDLSNHLTEDNPANPKWYDKAFGKTSPIGLSLPFGMGVKLSLTRHMAATVEWRMQKTFTDYLDDVATVYPRKHATVEINGTNYDLTDPTGNYDIGQQRGNSAFNDWFGMGRVSLTWKFNLPDGRGCNLSIF